VRPRQDSNPAAAGRREWRRRKAFQCMMNKRAAPLGRELRLARCSFAQWAARPRPNAMFSPSFRYGSSADAAARGLVGRLCAKSGIRRNEPGMAACTQHARRHRMIKRFENAYAAPPRAANGSALFKTPRSANRPPFATHNYEYLKFFRRSKRSLALRAAPFDVA